MDFFEYVKFWLARGLVKCAVVFAIVFVLALLLGGGPRSIWRGLTRRPGG
jgi:hypothetical protein